jgi:hypothetical protein
LDAGWGSYAISVEEGGRKEGTYLLVGEAYVHGMMKRVDIPQELDLVEVRIE